MILDTSSLHDWFKKNKRELPWRHHLDPYAIWISEVMLQQTQVATVIPYFARWMNIFPDVESLASASSESVIKIWEGLGYYSRARSLHEGAKYIMTHFGGKIPADKDQLKLIKGLGPYTIGAILSFAFHQKISAVDGNVMRVLTRYFKIEEDISKTATQKHLRILAESILPENESWITNEALIELGATICQRKALCTKCPLVNSCLSYKEGAIDRLPLNTKKTVIESLYRAVPVIQWKETFLVQKGEPGKIMSDLYQFPFFETLEKGIPHDELQRMLQLEFGLATQIIHSLSEVKHAFTRYRVRLHPVLLSCSKGKQVDGYEWKTLKQLRSLAFSSGHRRILEYLELHSK